MKRLAKSTLSAALLAVAACATAPENPVQERLDERSGITVTSMSAALQFFAPQPELGLKATSFAFLAALETNRMGNRDTYIWLSVLPGSDPSGVARAAGTPESFRILADGNKIEPKRLTGDPKTLGLSERVFRSPAQWAPDAYYAISTAELRQLAAAASLSLELPAEAGTWRRYQPWNDSSEPLRRFVQRITE